VRRGLVAWVRGLALGYLGKASLTFLYSFITKLRHKTLKEITEDSFGRDSLRVGAVLGSMSGGFSLIYDMLEHWFPDFHFNSFIAGTVAGSTLLLDKNKDRRQDITLYVVVRAVCLVGQWLTEKGYLPAFNHWNAVVFIIGCSIGMYACAYEPDTFKYSYYRWARKLPCEWDLDMCRHLSEGPLPGDTEKDKARFNHLYT